MRKIVALALASCIGIGVAPVYATTAVQQVGKEVEKPTLTVEQAVERAVRSNRDLWLNGKSLDLQEVLVDEMMSASYKAFRAAITQRDFVSKNQKVLEESVRYNTAYYFSTVISTEAQRDMMQQMITLTQKELRSLTVRYNQGLVSELALQQEQKNYNQMLANLNQVEASLQTLYKELSNWIGQDVRSYDLVPTDYAFTPYTLQGKLDTVITNAIDKNISMWLATQQASNAHDIDDYTFYNGLSSIKQYQYGIDSAENNVVATKQRIEARVLQQYNQLMQLQQDYPVLVQEVALAQKQVAMMELRYEKGLASKLAYDQAVMAYENAQMQLKAKGEEHYFAKWMMEKPYLIN